MNANQLNNFLDHRIKQSIQTIESIKKDKKKNIFFNFKNYKYT